MYLDIPESRVPSRRGLLTYVRDDLNAGSAGEKKVFSFIVMRAKIVPVLHQLSLAGALDELNASDYALTRALPECAVGAAGFKEVAAIKASHMMAFLEAVKVKGGRMEKFVMDVIGMSKADGEALRAVLRGEF